MSGVSKAMPGPSSSTDHKKLVTPNGRKHGPNRSGTLSSKKQHKLLRVKLEAIESMHRGLLIADRQDTIIWVNQAMRQLTGYAPEEIVGQNPRLFRSGR